MITSSENKANLVRDKTVHEDFENNEKVYA